MSLARITNVWIDSYCHDETTGRGMAITAELSNDAYFCVSLDAKANEPLFQDVVRGKCGKPETDGTRAYWQNGASLTVQEMVELLQSGNN